MSARFLSSVIGGASLTAMLLATSHASAQQAPGTTGEPEDELPRYTVELIVFTYADSAYPGSEIFVPDRPPVDEYLQTDPARPPDSEFVFSDVPARIREEPDQPPAAGETDTAPGDGAPEGGVITGIDENLQDLPLRTRIELHLLEPEQYTMDEIYERLVTLDAYQPIMRTAWTQTTPAENESPDIRLRALGDPPPGLDGTVKLYQGRFVHLGLDLALDAEGADATGAAPYSERRSATDQAIAYGDARVGHDDGARNYGNRGLADGGLLRRPVRYHISESRIMRNGEIRYYDHPRFGVIAKLTEFKEEKEEAAADKALAGSE